MPRREGVALFRSSGESAHRFFQRRPNPGQVLFQEIFHRHPFGNLLFQFPVHVLDLGGAVPHLLLDPAPFLQLFLNLIAQTNVFNS